MSNDAQQLWQELSARQLVQGPLTPALQQPWYLRMFLAVTAWLAAQFFLLSVVAIPGTVLFFLSSSQLHQSMVVLGSVLLALAAWISRLQRSVFVHQLAVAAALTGQGLVLVGLALLELPVALALLIALVQVPVFLLVRDTFVRGLCVPVFVIALTYALAGFAVEHEQTLLLQGVLPLLLAVTGWLYLEEARLACWQQWIRPLKRGLTLALWAWLVLQHTELLALGRGGLWAHKPLLLTLVLAGFLGWLLLHKLQQPSERLYGLALGVLVACAGWQIPGVTVTVLLLALAWLQGQRLYWGANMVVLLGMLLLYYYNLEQTLLVKSMILTGLAVLLLGLRFWLLRLPGLNRPEKETADA